MDAAIYLMVFILILCVAFHEAKLHRFLSSSLQWYVIIDFNYYVTLLLVWLFALPINHIMLRVAAATLKKAFAAIRVRLRYFAHEKPQTPRHLNILAGRFLNIKFMNLWAISYTANAGSLLDQLDTQLQQCPQYMQR